MNQFSGIQLPNDVRSSLLSGLEFIAYFRTNNEVMECMSISCRLAYVMQ